jgi:hypothetical protein
VIATAGCAGVSRYGRSRASWRLWCGLAAVAVATALYVLGLAVKDASAGTPEAVETAQLAAPPATNGAIEAGGSTTPATVAAPAATSGAVEPGGSTVAAGVAPAASEQAATNQVAQGDAEAAQEGPINLLISVRINSPGDNGPVTQTNVVVADAGGSNTASTTQPAPAGGTTNASTDQQATADATATQDAAGNIVVVVRINSPGNNGPVSQTNASVADSQAQNSSGTTQAPAAAAPAPTSAPANAAATSTRPAPRPDPAPPARPRQEAVAPAAPTSVSPATSSLASQSSGATAPRAAHHHRHATSQRAKNRAARGPIAGRADNVTLASPLGSAIGKAGNLLGTIAPRAQLGPARRQGDVSSAVLLSLLGGLAICAAFVGWSLRPGRLRPKRLPSLLR